MHSILPKPNVWFSRFSFVFSSKRNHRIYASNCCIRNCIKFIIEFCVGKINVVPATTTAAAAAVVGATAAVSLQFYGIKFCVLVIRYAFNWQLCFKRNTAGKNGSSLAVVMVFPSVYKIY